MRCDQCKHWDTEEIEPEWDAEAIGFHKCRAMRERWRIQDEASGKLDYESKDYSKVRNDALKSARAYVQDGSQYMAELVTGPDFFCAFFAALSNAKENENDKTK